MLVVELEQRGRWSGWGALLFNLGRSEPCCDVIEQLDECLGIRELLGQLHPTFLPRVDDLSERCEVGLDLEPMSHMLHRAGMGDVAEWVCSAG